MKARLAIVMACGFKLAMSQEVAQDSLAKEVVLDEGKVVTAVMASASLPLVFPPLEMEGMVLIDGGVMNNVPFDVARARGAMRRVPGAQTRCSPGAAA